MGWPLVAPLPFGGAFCLLAQGQVPFSPAAQAAGGWEVFQSVPVVWAVGWLGTCSNLGRVV